jgi:hypothetical protein
MCLLLIPKVLRNEIIRSIVVCVCEMSLVTSMVLYVVPSKMTGRQNNFSSTPTPFETRGRNVTVCPAKICCCNCNTFYITEMLSAYYTL